MLALQQNSHEWKEFRKQKIGASDAPVIMQVSPWMTPYQLWEVKMGVREVPINDRMREGINKEEEARRSFEDQTGLVMFPQVKLSKEYDWMMASFDGLDIEGKHLVEIKCPGEKDHSIAMNGEIPEKYIPQLQHQLFVSELDRGFYFSYTHSSSKIIEFLRDDSYISKMITEEKKFYNNMQELTPPKMTDRDYVLREDEEWRCACISYLSVRQELERLEKAEKELRELLISLAGRSNAKGEGITLSRILRKGAVDYSKIPELEGINLELYRKDPIETWRITC